MVIFSLQFKDHSSGLGGCSLASMGTVMVNMEANSQVETGCRKGKFRLNLNSKYTTSWQEPLTEGIPPVTQGPLIDPIFQIPPLD